MTSSTVSTPWDLSPVFDLIQSLSHNNVDSAIQLEPSTSPAKSTPSGSSARGKENHEQNLGDFNRIWDFLGVRRAVPPPKVPTFEASTASKKKETDAYASDGALYYPPSSKSVKWRDEEEGLNLTDVQPESPPDDATLSKSQRKKRNRKARKAAEEATAAAHKAVSTQKQLELKAKSSSDDSESKVTLPTNHISGLHKVDAECSSDPERLRIHPAPLEPSTAPAHGPPASKVKATAAILNSAQAKGPGALRPAQVKHTTPNKTGDKSHSRSSNRDTSPSKHPASYKTPEKPIRGSTHESLQKQRSIAEQYSATSVASTPQMSGLQSMINGTLAAASPAITSTPNSGRKRYELLPIRFNNPDDRNWSLLLKLIQRFPENRQHLLSPLQLSINRPTVNGIHVFVDASNIIIGFNDTLKRARGIPQYARVPRVNLNFHALALLLERRRPVTKRVLAGSTPSIPAFEEARQVGYETCILDKVWKAKELTDRQRRFSTRPATEPNAYQSGSDSGGVGSSIAEVFDVDSGTTAGNENKRPLQRPKWVEQAVDEILHLKILESIVDTPAPTSKDPVGDLQPTDAISPSKAAPPTMVLATGDAAEAEYSSGFMKMVQRALEKGWNVEVMAWGKSVSMEYRRMASSALLGSRFRVIELDDYAEELFGEAV